MNQMENMLEKVLNLTENGGLKWSTTVNPDAFLTVLGRQSVVISKDADSGRDEDFYTLEVRNSGGSPIAALRSRSYELSRMPPDRQDGIRRKMKKVFDYASESAVSNGLAEIIDKLDELIGELERA